jgi:serine/threonine protein kinase
LLSWLLSLLMVHLLTLHCARCLGACTVSGLMTFPNFKSAVLSICSLLRHPISDIQLEEDFSYYDTSHTGVMSAEDFYHYCCSSFGESRPCVLKFFTRRQDYEDSVRLLDYASYHLDEAYCFGLLPPLEEEVYQTRYRDDQLLFDSLFSDAYPMNFQDKKFSDYNAGCMIMLRGEKSFRQVLKEEPLILMRNLQYAYQLLQGLEHMHRQGVVHGQVCLENTLLFRQRMHWIDFKSAYHFGSANSLAPVNQYYGHRIPATGYLAPEVFVELSSSQAIDRYLSYHTSSTSISACIPYATILEGQRHVFVVRGYDRDRENDTESLPYSLLTASEGMMIDAWSFGLLLFEVFFGVSFFPIDAQGNLRYEEHYSEEAFALLKLTSSNQKIREKIDFYLQRAEGSANAVIASSSKEVAFILERLLDVNPKQRASIAEILPYFESMLQNLAYQTASASAGGVANGSSFASSSHLQASCLEVKKLLQEKERNVIEEQQYVNIVANKSKYILSLSTSSSASSSDEEDGGDGDELVLGESFHRNFYRALLPNAYLPSIASYHAIPASFLLLNRSDLRPSSLSLASPTTASASASTVSSPMQQQQQQQQQSKNSLSVKNLTMIEQSLLWHEKVLQAVKVIEEAMSLPSYAMSSIKDFQVKIHQQVAEIFRGENLYIYQVDELRGELASNCGIKLSTSTAIDLLLVAYITLKLTWKSLASDPNLRLLGLYFGCPMDIEAVDKIPDKFLDRMQRHVSQMDRYELNQDRERYLRRYDCPKSVGLSVVAEEESSMEEDQLAIISYAMKKMLAIYQQIDSATATDPFPELVRLIFAKQDQQQSMIFWTRVEVYQQLVRDGLVQEDTQRMNALAAIASECTAKAKSAASAPSPSAALTVNTSSAMNGATSPRMSLPGANGNANAPVSANSTSMKTRSSSMIAGRSHRMSHYYYPSANNSTSMSNPMNAADQQAGSASSVNTTRYEEGKLISISQPPLYLT